MKKMRLTKFVICNNRPTIPGLQPGVVKGCERSQDSLAERGHMCPAKGLKPRALARGVFILCVMCNLCIVIFPLWAQEQDKKAALQEKIVDAKDAASLYASFEVLKESYFSEHKYSEFVDSLVSLIKQKKALEPLANYYIGVSRFSQLKYLQEKQEWNEYFGQGDAYRNQMMQALEKATESLSPKEPAYLYAKLTLWDIYKEQQDPLADEVLDGLLKEAHEYAKEATDLTPLKDTAAQLSLQGEKGKAKEVYKEYVDKLVTAKVKDQELVPIAEGFLKEGNLDLAELVFDVYIGRLSHLTKEEALPLMLGIAKKFAYQDGSINDPEYAEKVFASAEPLLGKDGFSEEFLYLRGFNLEKENEFSKAKDSYATFLKLYPASLKSDELTYKVGVIDAYVLRDQKEAEGCFAALVDKTSPQGLSSLYQLGLLSQWGGDLVKAKTYYDTLVSKAGSNSPETLARTQDRLKEIAEQKPLSYPIKLFLDSSLKENTSFGNDLKSSLYVPAKDASVTVTTPEYQIASGCLSVEKQYFWSGDLNSMVPKPEAKSLDIQFKEPGTKVITLTIVSNSGVLQRSIVMVDVRN